MSVRRRMEAGYNSASSFSLRDCVSEKNTSSQITAEYVPSNNNKKLLSISPVGVAHVQTPQTKTTFSFNLDTLDKSNCGLNTGVSAVKKAMDTQLLSTVQTIGFGLPSNQRQQCTNIGLNPEIMRLTSQRDDLRTRLKKAVDKTIFLENQMSRLQKLTMNDRTEFGKQLSLAKNEIGNLRDSEAKLKSQITKSNSEAERKTSFEIALKTALKSKEILEMQAKFEELKKNNEVLELQINTLEEKKGKLLTDMESIQTENESKKTEFEKELVSLNTQIEDANTKMLDISEQTLSVTSTIEAKKTDIEETEAQLEEIEQSITDKNDEMTELQAQVEELASKLDEYEDTKRECEMKCCALKIQTMHHKNQIGKHRTTLLEIKQEHVAIQSKLQTAKDEITQNMNMPEQIDAPNKIKFHGDEPPEFGIACSYENSIYRQVEEMSTYENGLPYHFETDAPISLTGNSTHMSPRVDEVESLNEEEESEEVNTQAMLSAIVADLRTHLTQASVENEKRGLNRGSATGDSPLSGCDHGL